MPVLTEFLPYLTILVVLVSWVLGSKVRAATNTVIPFREPVSYIFMTINLFAFLYFDLEPYYSLIVAFWVGYLLGYVVLGEVTSEWVNDHDIQYAPGGMMRTHRVVFYEKDGQLYEQPQKLSDVCKHVFFGVEWPLDMPLGMVERHRLIIHEGDFIVQTHAAIDMNERKREPMVKECIRIGTYKRNWRGVNKWGDDSILGQPRYLLHFKCYRDSYKIAPYATDAPYEFIRKTGIYIRAIKQLQDARLANIDAEIEKILRTTEGGAIMLSKLVKLTPEDLMMSPLVNEIDEVMRQEDIMQGQNRQKEREQVMREQAERSQAQEVEDDV